MLIILGADTFSLLNRRFSISSLPRRSVECFAKRVCQIRSPREHTLRRAGAIFTGTLRISGSEIDLIAHNFVPAVHLCGPKTRLLLGFAPRSGEGASHVVEALVPFQRLRNHAHCVTGPEMLSVNAAQLCLVVSE